MNLINMRHRIVRGVIAKGEQLLDSPVCDMTASMQKAYSETEEKLAAAYAIRDPLRFYARLDRSKYMPHQGARECERRVRQGRTP